MGLAAGGHPDDPSRLPVLVGVGQLRHNRERRLELAREPLELMVEASRRAAADAGPGEALLRAVDSLDVVDVITWAYDALPDRVADRLGIQPARRVSSAVGGNRPVELVDQAAGRIARGESRVALVCGAEAQASLELVLRAGTCPWSQTPGGPLAFDDAMHGGPLVRRHGLVDPIRGYPLFENRLRFERGARLEESQRESAELYADFTRVAADNPAAWNPTVLSPEDIATVTPKNRMICFPYPLRMNAFLKVDQAAAVLLTSLAVARELGIPEDRLVHVWGGAGAADSREMLDRVSYGRSPALEAVLDTTLAQAEVSVADVDVLDVYSCFPVVPTLARLHLGLARGHRLTATGGLTAFGGPGSNYSLHALVAVAGRLRAGARLGLVHGNGEYLTKQHALLLGARPHPRGYVGRDAPVTPQGTEGPRVVAHAEGRAVLETFTVEYDREGHPRRGFVIGRLADGARFVANTAEGDRESLDALVDPEREAIGRTGVVTHHPDGRNLFRFGDAGW